MFPNFGKIGVVCGGISSEREISLKSGSAVYETLLKEGLEVEKIDLTTENPDAVKDILRSAGVSIVFIAMHGRFGEDGKLQAILEEADIAYVGSDSVASAFAMDKQASRQIFQAHNIAVPKTVALSKDRTQDFNKDQLVLPVVIKPKAQGSSIGVSIVSEPGALDRALASAFYYDDTVLIEEFIKGREITVGILGERALTPIEIVSKNKFFDFQAKYTQGVTEYILPAPLEPELQNKIQRIASKAHRVLGCRHFSRVDMITDERGNPYVLEINTIPGFTATSLLPKAALYEGITFSRLCLSLLSMAAQDALPAGKNQALEHTQ